MKKIIGVSIGCFLIWVFPVIHGMSANVYVWTDENGVKHYSNVAPPESAGDAVEQVDELSGEGQEAEEPSLQQSLAAPDAADSGAPETTGDIEAEDGGAAAGPAEETANQETPPEETSAEETEESSEESEATGSDNEPLTQGDAVEEEKVRTRQLLDALSEEEQSSQVLLENEKRRLEQTIADLEQQPLERFGSQRNKRRQIGFYQNRLQQLISSPEVYLEYGDTE